MSAKILPADLPVEAQRVLELRMACAALSTTGLTDLEFLNLWLLAHPGWVSPHTKTNAVRVIVQCWRWAQDEEVIEHSRMRIPKGVIPPLRPRSMISPDEYRQLVRTIRQYNGSNGRRPRSSRKWFRAAMMFLWWTGARTCEMRNAEWEDVDWERGLIPFTKHKTAAATGEERLLSLGPRGLRLLRWIAAYRTKPVRSFSWLFRRSDRAGLYVRWMEPGSEADRTYKWKAFGKGPSARANALRFKRELDVRLSTLWGEGPRSLTGFIFTNGRGRKWTNRAFNCMFRKYRILAGIRDIVSAYSLRHGFAVKAIENGVQGRQLADVLGHTTTKYVDWYGRGSRSNAAHLQRVLDQIHKPRKK